MTSEANTDLVYPISIKWTFVESYFDECDSGSRLKTRRFILPGFPVTYYLTLDFAQVVAQDPAISIKFNCYCDYDDVEIEANFKTEVNPSGVRVTEIKCLFDDDTNEVECFTEIGWEDWDADEIEITVKGTLTIKGKLAIPLSIKVPKINQKMDADNAGKNFTIIAEGQEIKVHKSILQQVSPVFARMFESENWKETIESKIALPFLPFKLAQIAVNSCYGKKYWRDLDKNEYTQLYQFADQYDIIALKNAIKNCVILTPNNIIEYTNVVVESKCDELIRCCIDYIILCSQYSLPMRDIDKLTDSSKIQIADGMLVTPLIKRSIEEENTSQDDCE